MDEKKFQQVGDAISLFDPETKRVLEANQAFHPLSGCKTEEVQTLIKEFVTTQKIPFPYSPNLERADERKKDEIIAIHKQLRMQVREDAGKLG